MVVNSLIIRYLQLNDKKFKFKEVKYITMIEHSHYHCPKCNKSLTKDKKVILHFKKSPGDNFNEIYLAPEPGNYKFYTIPKTDFKKGDIVVFFCSKCQTNLTSKRDPKFAELKMKVNDFIYFEALFSTVYGDKRTYIITEDDIDVYGDANFEDMPFPDLSIGEVPY